jgi:hypothetical protein
MTFISRGIVTVTPQQMGVPRAVHDTIYGKLSAVIKSGQPSYSTVPELATLLTTAPGIVSALDNILGEGWAFVPFMHSHFVKMSDQDQGWHKDDNAIFNGRKFRHHRPVQAEVLYYPQDTPAHMGPTCVLPYSQYWQANATESDPHNFSGTDHLEYFATPTGQRWGALAKMDSSTRDFALEESVARTGWPLVHRGSFAHCSVQCPAGTAIIMTNNTYHRGSRRRDDRANWDKRPRFMWRMWAYRTREPPQPQSAQQYKPKDWQPYGIGDESLPSTATVIWDSILAYSQGQRHPRMIEGDEHKLHWLQEELNVEGGDTPPAINPRDLHSVQPPNGVEHEPRRVAAAYRLARLGEAGAAVLGLGLEHTTCEAVRRASCYGLATCAADCATPQLLMRMDFACSASTRKHAAFALGESGSPNLISVAALDKLLATDPSVWVRATAAGALGCLGIRSVAATAQPRPRLERVVGAAMMALCRCLDREQNRLPATGMLGLVTKYSGAEMDYLQWPYNGGYDFDTSEHKVMQHETDMCEGFAGGVEKLQQQEPRLRPLRSAVRENAAWALVQLAVHCTTLLGVPVCEVLSPKDTVLYPSSILSSGTTSVLWKSLTTVIAHDKNAFTVGHAMDALKRLAKSTIARNMPRPAMVARLEAVFATCGVRPPESLLRTDIM